MPSGPSDEGLPLPEGNREHEACVIEKGRGAGNFRYRIRQGVPALIPALAPLDITAREHALAVLPTPAAAAFRALPRSDQSHALRVYAALSANGETDPDLLAAALLHDIGKQPGTGVSQKTVRVLLAHRPGLLQRIARDTWPLRRWRNGLMRMLDHAAIGARLAEHWGCSPATVAIIRASHDTDAPEIIHRLQAVDDAN